MQAGVLDTPAGYKIAFKEFAGIKSIKDIVIIVPATGVKQSYYFKFADFLRNNGYVIFTFDYGGIGESRKYGTLKGFRTSATAWAKNDLEAVIRFATGKYPGLSLVLIGHSIGGQLIGLAPSSVQARQVIIVAAQNGYWKFWKGGARWRMLFNWYFLFPVITKIFGYFPGKLLGAMEDLPSGMVAEWRKWCTTPDYFFSDYDRESLFFDKIRGELTVYSIADDDFAPEEAVDWLAGRYKGMSMNRKHLVPADFGMDKIGHFGMFRSTHKDSFWNMMLVDMEQEDNMVK